MPLSERESPGTLKLLVCMAKAGGSPGPAERAVIEDA